MYQEKYKYLFIAILIAANCFAQDAGWQKKQSGTDNNLNAVYMLNQDTVFTCGDNGTLLKTVDKGITWENMLSGIRANLKDLTFYKNTGYIVGENGIVLKSEDKGQSWNNLSNEITTNINAVDFIDNSTGWLVGDNGKIFITQDGGVNWKEQNSGTSKRLNDVKVHVEKRIQDIVRSDKLLFTGLTVDAEGTIYTHARNAETGIDERYITISANGEINDFTESSIFDYVNALINHENTLYAAIVAGRVKAIYKVTTAGGEQNLSSLSYIPLDLDLDENNYLWVVGSQKLSKLNLDGELTTYDIPMEMSSIVSYQNNLFVAGIQNDIAHIWRIPVSENNEPGEPEVWFSFEQVDANLRISDLSVSVNGTVYAGFENRDGLFILNPNGNFNFIQTKDSYPLLFTNQRVDTALISISQDPNNDQYLVQKHILTTDTKISIIACGEGGILLRSTDLRENWQSVGSGSEADLLSMYKLNNSFWAAGDNGVVLISDDVGRTWIELNTGYNDKMSAIYSADEMQHWLVSRAGNIYKTENSGALWYQQIDGLSPLNDLFFINTKEGFAAGDQGSIYYTSNSGFGRDLSFTGADYHWMAAGALHNWFSKYGSDIEVGRVTGAAQQDGWQFPAIEPHKDSQASKGMWIGTTNFEEEDGNVFPYKVIHVGPRVSGEKSFTPIKNQAVYRFNPPLIRVNGNDTFDKLTFDYTVDPAIKSDQQIINQVNSAIGLSIKRNIRQFSLQNNDNYIVQEYIFKNTGNTDADIFPERYPKSLTNLYIFNLYRWAVNKEIGFLIQNSSRWGINTMLDARGDGSYNISFYGDPSDELFRAQFGWHGYHSDKNVPYDNIGAPIFYPDAEGYIAKDDTTGRLGASQFVGVVTLHADKSATDESDDPGQPSTTGFFSSDAPETTNNDPFDEEKMIAEYAWMTRGHMERHAWKIVPDGDFATQDVMGNIAPGQPGGFSAGNGYGPYDLDIGDSIKIVIAEASAGLSRKMNIEIGRQYKNGEISDLEKNQWVMTSRDSLFQTFRRAIYAYDHNYDLPQNPAPPASFIVDANSDHIHMEWSQPEINENVHGYRIYRSAGKIENEPVLIAETAADEFSYNDFEAPFDVEHYYYIQTVGDTIQAIPELGLVNGPLLSGRYFTQTYDPVIKGVVSIGKGKNNIPEKYELKQNYPNPFNPTTMIEYSLPVSGKVKFTLYNMAGQKIKDILKHEQNAGNHYFRLHADNLAAGIYILYMQAKSKSGNLKFSDSKKIILLK